MAVGPRHARSGALTGEPRPGQHDWTGAARLLLTDDEVLTVHERGLLPVSRDVFIDEVYCGRCRRTHRDAAGTPCEAVVPGG